MLEGVAACAALSLIGLTVLLVLAMRESWSFDLVLALVAVRYCSIASDRLSPWVDAFMP